MEKVFYNTQFIEGVQHPYFMGIKMPWKTKPTIDLISIGLIKEFSKESLYLVNRDFNVDEAWGRLQLTQVEYIGEKSGLEYTTEENIPWIRENVLKPIWVDLEHRHHIVNINPDTTKKEFLDILDDKKFKKRRFKMLLSYYGTSIDNIREELKAYLNDYYQLTGYYGDYSHVCLSWIFGQMDDLPYKLTQYTWDIKQMYDEVVDKYTNPYFPFSYELNTDEIRKINKNKVGFIENLNRFPKKKVNNHAEHEALFNYELYEFLRKGVYENNF